MVKFRISLTLHNFDKSKNIKIIKFYKTLANIIKSTYNIDVRKKQKQSDTYIQPFIKIKKHTFTEHTIDSTNPLHSIIRTMCPPKITIDITFKLTPEREEFALKRFYEIHNSMNSKTYKELKALYYSTKIINFVNNLKSLLHYNTLWLYYTNEIKLKTKYKPNIDVSDAIVLSLN